MLDAVHTFPDGPYPVDLDRGKLPRVCIVTGECVGLFRNGGLGTSMTGLAELLAAHGFPVSILYTGELDGDPEPWVKKYAQAGLELLILDRMATSEICGPLAARGWTAAYRVYEVLRRRSFDVIHFNDTVGEALYCTTAKRLGIAFKDSLLCLAVHSPTQWILELNGTPQDWIGYTCFSQGERDSAAATDLLWGPSRYLLQWIQDHEFRLPSQVFNQQYVVPTTRLFEGGTGKLALLSPASREKAPEPPREIVFFGRLEERKGIRVFCNALTLVAKEIEAADVSVVFMGKPSTINGKPSLEFLEEKTKNWSFQWKLIDNYDQQQALRYLTKGDCVSVMPSPFDNSPCTVYEAIQNQIPFVAARRGGIPELIHDDDRAATLFEYTTDDLAAKLRQIIAQGIHPARPPITIDANRGRWIAMHLAWKRYRDAAPRVAAPMAKPRIAVVIDHAGRDEALTATVLSLQRVLGRRLGRCAVILRGAANPGATSFDLVVEDHGESSTGSFEAWIKSADEDAVLCIRSGVTLRPGALWPLQQALGQPSWDALFATGEMHDGTRRSVMPMVASPLFLLLEDKYDTGAAVFRRAAIERLVTNGKLVAEQPWCGLVDCFALQRAVFWPMAEPLVDLTPASAEAWRGEHARRSLRYTQMMAHDLHFALGIGYRTYQSLFPQHLALPSSAILKAPAEFVRSGGARRAAIGIFHSHPVKALKRVLPQVFSRPVGMIRGIQARQKLARTARSVLADMPSPVQKLKSAAGTIFGRPIDMIGRIPARQKVTMAIRFVVADMPTAIAWLKHRMYYRRNPIGPVIPIDFAASGQWRRKLKSQARERPEEQRTTVVLPTGGPPKVQREVFDEHAVRWKPDNARSEPRDDGSGTSQKDVGLARSDRP